MVVRNMISSPRRRALVLKCLLLFGICFGLLLWLSGKYPPLETPNQYFRFRGYEKADAPLENPQKRKLVENLDEFLIPVLQDYQYVEIDLQSKGFLIHPNDDYDDEIGDDLSRIVEGLGDKGKSGKVPEFQTSVANEIMKKEAFNRLLSDMISPNRSVPDTREYTCRSLSYNLNSLPTASVVIIYTDEAFSSLLRTLHSVINRSPPQLLQEIILVDDFSSRRDLKGKLERYLATRFPQGKIRLVKIEKRAGLIRARMLGAHIAQGDVLVFLDAHCETVDTWLEPLLQRIREERKAVVCPIIDVIDDKTLEYAHGNGAFFQIGGFTWSGHFTWINIPKRESNRKVNHYDATQTPTMAGGLFAIDRRYFWEIGSYDSDMVLWGGENLEMSFRVWQCGGSVEIIPCSRVGHIFRSFHPYSFPGNVDSHGLNTARLVEVWMDDYKDIFYSHRHELKTASYGSVEKRRKFRERLGCKSFTWYLDNVYPEKFRLWFGSKYSGQFRNVATNRCLDNMAHGDSEDYVLTVYPCHPILYPSQTFYISNDSELRRENECGNMKMNGEKHVVEMVSCENAEKEVWEYSDDGSLRHSESGRCLNFAPGPNELTLDPCDSDSLSQKWKIDGRETLFNPQ